MTVGNFLTLKRWTNSLSSSVMKPNFTVRLKTVSLERAFQMVGGVFLLEKSMTLG
eukprot:CAMPEP_0175555740 /NCGR_PEP_ID=MMETSP0096-20121207/34515_1 /TAXON_ID=311494 /ORGANISM="Alexandrium monilatum, Strain CCMP3105" /LENGTH=54 /DNA_ID=CAMNT_0016858867 /DNA_START=66 /DNA_END=227 /DNA_ORIENTATION=-